MSIYSGFATRFQQQSYDHCIDSLLYILQKRIIKFYQNQQADQEKFITLVIKLHQQMRNMEKNKYLQPKSSQSVVQLVKFMQIYQENVTFPKTIEQSEHESITQKLPVVELKVAEPEVTIEKKKSIYWVQKNSNQKDNTVELKQNPNPNNNNHSKQKAQFRRTAYNVGTIRGVKLKHTSRTNLSKDHKQPVIEIPLKDRSMSTHLGEIPNTIQSKVPYYANKNVGEVESNATRKRKSKSSFKGGQVNQTEMLGRDTRNEVSDIIKEYIIKTKKNYLRGYNSREVKQSLAKLHDF